jgi:hypothetical protein
VAHQHPLLFEADLQFAHHRPVGVAEVMPAEVGDADFLARGYEMVGLERISPEGRR